MTTALWHIRCRWSRSHPPHPVRRAALQHREAAVNGSFGPRQACHADVRLKLCKARFLRIAALGARCSKAGTAFWPVNVSFCLTEMITLQVRRMLTSHPSRALTHSKAARQKAFGVYILDCHRLGQADVSGFRLSQPKNSSKTNT